MLHLKINYEQLSQKVSERLGKTISPHYISCIFTPSGKSCSDDVRGAIISEMMRYVEDDFDLYQHIEELFRRIKT